MASAPAPKACGGRSGWKPKCAAQAASTTRGMPASCATRACSRRSENVPTYDGSTRKTARTFGCRAMAAATRSGATPVGRPVAVSTSGLTQMGVRPASTSPSKRERCSVRDTMTSSPGLPMASASVWFPWVDPPTEKRQASAPQRSAAFRSACWSQPYLNLTVSSPPEVGKSPETTTPVRAVEPLWPGVVKECSPAARRSSAARYARSSGASAARPSGSRGSTGEASGRSGMRGLLYTVRRRAAHEMGRPAAGGVADA